MTADRYRWWTVTAWHECGDGCGLKLGPLTIADAWWDRRKYLSVQIFNRWTLYDGVLRQIQQHRRMDPKDTP